MTTESDCFVCRKHGGEIEVPGGVLYEDDLVYASHGAMDGRESAYPGILFAEPRRHALLPDLTDAEAERVGLLTTRLARALQVAAKDVERVYTAVLGHHVDHLHVWVFPRYRGTPPDVWGTAVLEWRGAPRADREAIAALCQRVREQLADETPSGR